MIKPNFQEILENLPKELKPEKAQDVVEPQSRTEADIFKERESALDKALKEYGKDVQQSDKIEFLQRIQEDENLSHNQQVCIKWQARIYLSYVRNFTIDYHEFQACSELMEEFFYYRLYHSTSLDDEFNNNGSIKSSDAGLITKHILFKVLFDSLGYDTYYTYLGYWKRENNKEIFCPFLALHPSHPHAKALDDYLSQIPQNKKEKGRFYYDIASEPSLEYNYPNITYFQIHKIISLCYKAIANLKKWQIEVMIKYFTEIDSFYTTIHFNVNDFADMLTRLKFHTPDIADCAELLFHHISYVANFFGSTDVLSLIKQIKDKIKDFRASHSNAQVQALLEISYNASKFDLYTKENIDYRSFEAPSSYKFIQRSGVIPFLNTLHCAVQYYPQLFMSKGYEASLFVDSLMKSLALRAISISTKENRNFTKEAHFDIARRAVFSYLYISGNIEMEYSYLRCEFYLHKHTFFSFLSNLAEYQRYGRGLYEWNGFDYVVKGYRSYVAPAYKAKRKRQLQKLRKLTNTRNARFELFSHIDREQIEGLQRQINTFDVNSIHCFALLDIEQSKLLLQTLLDILYDKNIKPSLELVTEFGAISIGSEELKNMAYIHLESFFGFIYDECMVKVAELDSKFIELDRSDFAEHCLSAILQIGQWESVLEHLQQNA